MPGKNIRPVLGKPLIAYVVETARAARTLDRVILSTDDPEIARTAGAHGCETPFMRPAALATAEANSVDVALHALDEMEARGERFDMLALLQPTSPLSRAQDIDACVIRARDDATGACYAICGLPKPVSHYGSLSPDGRFSRDALSDALGESRIAMVTGSCYAIRCETLRRERNFLPANAATLETPWLRSADIDTLEDFLLAEQAARILSDRED